MAKPLMKRNKKLGHLVPLCISGLNDSKRDLLAMRGAQNANAIILNCHAFKIKIHAVKKNLGQSIVQMNEEQQKIQNKLVKNREQFSNIKRDIDIKNDEIRRLRAQLAEHEAKVAGYNDKIGSLEGDIRRKRREKKRKEERAIAAGVATGLLTFGFGAIVAGGATAAVIAALTKDINSTKDKINHLRNEKNAAENNKNATLHAINQTKRNQNSLTEQRRSLQKEQTDLDSESKTLGRAKVKVANGIRNMEQATIKCDDIISKVYMVKQLAKGDLLELIGDRLNVLDQRVDETRNHLNRVKQIAY